MYKVRLRVSIDIESLTPRALEDLEFYLTLEGFTYTYVVRPEYLQVSHNIRARIEKLKKHLEKLDIDHDELEASLVLISKEEKDNEEVANV